MLAIFLSFYGVYGANRQSISSHGAGDDGILIAVKLEKMKRIDRFGFKHTAPVTSATEELFAICPSKGRSTAEYKVLTLSAEHFVL